MKRFSYLIILSSFLSCVHPINNGTQQENNGNKQKYNDTIVLPPPKIIQVGAPRVVKAGNPIVRVVGEPRIEPVSYFSYSKDAHHERSCIIHNEAFDKKGNLWFTYVVELKIDYENFDTLGTHFDSYNSLNTVAEGLCSFDGKKFSTYTTLQGLPDSTIESIFIDKKGNLWIGTEWHGISCFDGKCFNNYDTAQGLVNNYILSIFQDRNGIMWFGTFNGLCSFDKEKFSIYTKVQGLSPDAVVGMEEDNKNNLWLGTWGGGVYSFDGKSLINYTTVQGLPHNTVLPNCSKPLMKDSRDDIWAITTRGVCRYDDKDFVAFNAANGITNFKVSSFFQDKNGNFWFGANDTAICYNGKETKIYSIAKDTNENPILMIVQDSVNNLYFGTFKRGIIKYDGKTFVSLFQ